MEFERGERLVNWRGIKYSFRQGPVPNIHSYRASSGTAFRTVRTTAERAISLDPEHRDYVRPARNKRNLPNSWDEIDCSNDKNYCWKTQRKGRRQWMRKK